MNKDFVNAIAHRLAKRLGSGEKTSDIQGASILDYEYHTVEEAEKETEAIIAEFLWKELP